jgi:hypothetical protein
MFHCYSDSLSKTISSLIPVALIVDPPETRTPRLGLREAPHNREAPCQGQDTAPCASGPAGAQRDDAYPAIARINAKTRVIECRDHLQWIVQRREGKRWRNVSFQLDRDMLIARSGATGDALDILHTLPRRHP